MPIDFEILLITLWYVIIPLKFVIHDYAEEFSCGCTSDSTVLHNKILSSSYKFSMMKYHVMILFHIYSQSICIQTFSNIFKFIFNVLINSEYSVPSRKQLQKYRNVMSMNEKIIHQQNE